MQRLNDEWSQMHEVGAALVTHAHFDHAAEIPIFSFQHWGHQDLTTHTNPGDSVKVSAVAVHDRGGSDEDVGDPW